MGIDTTAYNVVFVLHILAVVYGFGTVALNGIRGADAKKRPGPGGLAIGESMFHVSNIAEKFIYAVPILGFALVGMSDGTWALSQTWVWLSFVLYLIGIGITHALMIPAEKRMVTLVAELVAAGPPSAGPPSAGALPGRPPQVAEMEQLEKKMAPAGAVLNLILAVIVALMIFKPGV